ncbi:MAG: glycosyltransferase family 39 protein [Candidatus Latescibacteria bacterium]|nr:glycosyltransferase family 39 protein [Candidatus Latescibacterota bacterium]
MNPALLSLLALGLALRLWGIGQGYPEFYGHVDEIGVAASIWNFFRAGTLLPTEFTYPAFYSYLTAAALWLTGLVGLVSHPLGLMDGLVLQSFLDPARAALVGRSLSALLSGLTVYLTYRLGSEAFGQKVGLVAALFLALARLPIEQAHQALPDSAMACLATACFYWSWKVYRRGAWPDYLWAGVFAGLVVATKYNGAFTALGVAAAHLCRREPGWYRAPKWWAAAGCGLAALFAGSPYLFLAPERYLQVASYQVSSLDFAQRETTPWWWVVRGLVQLEWGVGGLMVAGVALACRERRPVDWIFLAAWIPSFLYIGSWTRESLHYLLHFYPLLAIGAARVVSALVARLPARSGWQYLLVGGLVLPNLWLGVVRVRELGWQDTRLLAGQWIEQHVPTGGRLAMTWLPYCPRLDLESNRQGLREYCRSRPGLLEPLEQAWRRRPAYQLVNLEVWLKEPVVPEAYAGLVDLADPETRRVFSRGWRSLRQLREQGVQYLVLPEAIYGRYLEGEPPAAPSAAQFHLLKNRAYFSQFTADNPELARVASFTPGPGVRGGPIHIYRLLP